MRASRYLAFSILVVGIVSILGCTGNPTGLPPKPKFVHGETPQDEHFTFLAWKNGLRLLIVDDFRGDISRKSDFSQGDDSAYVFGENAKTEAVEMSWTMQTSEGRTGIFILDGDEYDLTKGAIFVASEGVDGFVVEQINEDLSNLVVKDDEIGVFVSRVARSIAGS